MSAATAATGGPAGSRPPHAPTVLAVPMDHNHFSPQTADQRLARYILSTVRGSLAELHERTAAGTLPLGAPSPPSLKALLEQLPSLVAGLRALCAGPAGGHRAVDLSSLLVADGGRVFVSAAASRRCPDPGYDLAGLGAALAEHVVLSQLAAPPPLSPGGVKAALARLLTARPPELALRPSAEPELIRLLAGAAALYLARELPASVGVGERARLRDAAAAAEAEQLAVLLAAAAGAIAAGESRAVEALQAFLDFMEPRVEAFCRLLPRGGAAPGGPGPDEACLREVLSRARASDHIAARALREKLVNEDWLRQHDALRQQWDALRARLGEEAVPSLPPPPAWAAAAPTAPAAPVQRASPATPGALMQEAPPGAAAEGRQQQEQQEQAQQVGAAAPAAGGAPGPAPEQPPAPAHEAPRAPAPQSPAAHLPQAPVPASAPQPAAPAAAVASAPMWVQTWEAEEDKLRRQEALEGEPDYGAAFYGSFSDEEGEGDSDGGSDGWGAQGKGTGSGAEEDEDYMPSGSEEGEAARMHVLGGAQPKILVQGAPAAKGGDRAMRRPGPPSHVAVPNKNMQHERLSIQRRWMMMRMSRSGARVAGAPAPAAAGPARARARAARPGAPPSGGGSTCCCRARHPHWAASRRRWCRSRVRASRWCWPCWSTV